MVEKRVFVLGIFLVLLFSFVCSASVTDGSTSVTTPQETTQNFAQVNARLTELANQVNAFRVQDQNFQANAFMKSDIQALYENMIVINRQSEQAILLNNIVIVVLAFCIFFILVGKNLLPVHTKEHRESKEKENKILVKENDNLRSQLNKVLSITPKKGLLDAIGIANIVIIPTKKEPKIKESEKKVILEPEIILPEAIETGKNGDM